MAASTAPERLDVLVVGGCGHVGLPLGIMLAKAGVQVGAYDTDEVRRATVAAWFCTVPSPRLEVRRLARPDLKGTVQHERAA